MACENESFHTPFCLVMGCDLIEPAKRAKYKPTTMKRMITAYGKYAEMKKVIFALY